MLGFQQHQESLAEVASAPTGYGEARWLQAQRLDVASNSQQVSADAAIPSGISVLDAFSGTESIMSDEGWFPRTAQQIVRALRNGGYACFIPSVIVPIWDDAAAPLAGLPISICFISLPPKENRDDRRSYLVSCYWFDPKSYDETEEYQSMNYRSRSASPYQVVIVYSKKKRIWEGRKLRDGEVVVAASGPEFLSFVVQLTMRGIDDGEAVERMLTRTDTASTGIWLYETAAARNALLH